MSEFTQNFPSNHVSQTLETWASKFALWLSNHWLAIVNTIFFLYAGLPFLAPVLLTTGFTGSANVIYWLYHLACHTLPSRAYFIAGEQVCLCHRCIAIYGTIFIGGLFFSLVRRSLKPLSPKWYLLFMLPMALDGGMGLASELLQFIPMIALWVIGLVLIGLVSVILYTQNQLNWPISIFLTCGLLALIYLQFFAPHQSNLFLRNITGFSFGIGTVWVAYPLLQEGFGDIRQETQTKLVRSAIYNKATFNANLSKKDPGPDPRL